MFIEVTYCDIYNIDLSLEIEVINEWNQMTNGNDAQ